MVVQALVATVVGLLTIIALTGIGLIIYAGYLRATGSVPDQNDRGPKQVLYFTGYVSAVGYAVLAVMVVCYVIGSLVMGVV